MKPRPAPSRQAQEDLFKSELVAIIATDHPLVKLARTVDWENLDKVFGKTFSEGKGRPAISTRLMVALHYLKYTYNISDESVVEAWVENPYWQFLSGMKFFEHAKPIDPSSMTRWRNRVGKDGAEEMLKETIRTGLITKAVKPTQLKKVNVDTTVQEKNIRFPTDGRLYDRARETLVRLAKKQDIKLRQTYSRVGKRLLLKASRYAHARQGKRAAKCTQKLKTILGRVIRDIERKLPETEHESKNARLRKVLEIAKNILTQQRHDKHKTYSVHEPHVECISKGKAHKRYEFGVKVAVATTSRGGWFLASDACHGNPYDGHTLSATLDQVARVAGNNTEDAFVDRGYRGHDYAGDINVHVDKVRRGKTARSLWRWMKRRAAVEPSIGHLKREHRLDRNYLAGDEGDHFNAIMSAAGMNFWKLLKHAAISFYLLLFSRRMPVFRPFSRVTTRNPGDKIQLLSWNQVLWAA